MTAIDITKLNSEIAWICLWPAMAHPNDKRARDRYSSYLAALIRADEKQTYLVEAAGLGVSKDFENAIQGGCMAGDVLLVRMEMIIAKIPDAGLDKAQHVVSEYYGGFHDPTGTRFKDGFLSGEGKPFKAGRDTVRDNWKKYCNAAHIWAAYLILLREAETNQPRSNPRTWLDGLKIAMLAMSLKQFTETLKVTGRGGVLLPQEAFEIIGVEPTRLDPPALTPSILEAIKTFKPRYKTS